MVTLFEKQTPIQLITLEGSDGGLKLYLDGFYQFDTETERHYHGFIATFPLVMHGAAERVLILGGGDALALRDTLKFPVTEVFLIELDPEMIRFASKSPMNQLNEGALEDLRAKVVIGDALKEIDRFPAEYFDLIIADFPAATNSELEKLYVPEFYDKILSKLAPDGIFVSQISEDAAFARELRKYLEATLGHGMTVVIHPKITENQPFVYGSRRPFEIRREPPADSVVAAAIPGLSREMEAGKKVIGYTPNRKVYRGPLL